MSFVSQNLTRSHMYQEVVGACNHLLRHSNAAAKAREYLDSRIPKGLQEEFGFGYFPADQDLSELFQLVDRQTLEGLNFLYPRYVSGAEVDHGHFGEHNLIMPFRDAHGNIAALLGRSLLTDSERDKLSLQKYKYSLGCYKGLYVFGLDKARDSIIQNDCVIGVEGQFDYIACRAVGLHNVVAFGGANVSRYQMFQLHRYTNNVILMLDNDEAGQKAKRRIRKRFLPQVSIKTVAPPGDHKDIDEFLRKESDLLWKQQVIDGLKDLARNNKEKNGS